MPDVMPRCATCKWFAAYDGYPGDIGEGWGVCSLIDGQSDPEEPGTKAMVLNQFAVDGILAVAPDFGCVQHEPKGD